MDPSMLKSENPNDRENPDERAQKIILQQSLEYSFFSRERATVYGLIKKI